MCAAKLCEGESSGRWRCGTGQCIPVLWHCDNEIDCDDGADEEECPSKLCGLEEESVAMCAFVCILVCTRIMYCIQEAFLNYTFMFFSVSSNERTYQQRTYQVQICSFLEHCYSFDSNVLPTIGFQIVFMFTFTFSIICILCYVYAGCKCPDSVIVATVFVCALSIVI